MIFLFFFDFSKEYSSPKFLPIILIFLKIRLFVLYTWEGSFNLSSSPDWIVFFKIPFKNTFGNRDSNYSSFTMLVL